MTGNHDLSHEADAPPVGDVVDRGAVEAIVAAAHGNPYSILGPHEVAHWRVGHPRVHPLGGRGGTRRLSRRRADRPVSDGSSRRVPHRAHRVGGAPRLSREGHTRQVRAHNPRSVFAWLGARRLRHRGDHPFQRYRLLLHLRGTPDSARQPFRHPLRGLGAERPQRKRHRRLQRLGWAPAPDALSSRCRRLGDLRARPCERGRLQVRDQGASRRGRPAEGRSRGLRGRASAGNRIGRTRSAALRVARRRLARGTRRARRPQQADLDLRMPPRLLAPEDRRGATGSSPIGRWPTRWCPTSKTWGSATSRCCRSPSSPTTARGVTNRCRCSRRPVVSARRRTSPISSTRRTRPASA